MSLQTQFNSKTHTLIIYVPKKLNELTFEAFKSSYEINDGLINPEIYEVNLAKTEVVNSTGLLSILSLFHYANDRKAKVVLLNSKPQVKQVLIENQYNEIMKLG